MRRFQLTLILALALALLPGLASAEDTAAGRLPSEYPVSGTPHVLDGDVYSIAQVGGTIVLGGGFSSARNDSSTTQLARSNLLAFNATTGQISTTFVPNPNGTVRKVMAAPDGTSVYVAGSFTTINGVARRNLARIRISDGAVLSTFNAGTISGVVRDLALVNGRLWLAGAFTHVGGHAQPALATVNPETGAWLPYMGLTIAGIHNDGVTQVLKIDATPDGSRLMAVGNFDTLQGVTNHQFLQLDLSGASAAPGGLRTSFYTTRCSSSFDTYMRDVSVSPDGRFFVIATTGAYGGSTVACDTTARFETNAVGDNVQPSWVDYTGGDTTYAVEVTDNAVYVGGHMRWQNNPFAGDRAGQGAVSREGIAALDPVNGLPLSWDPGRTKGVGVYDFLDTPQGLWVSSDTDRIGHFSYRGRIALMPPNGEAYPAVRTPGLPNAVYSGGASGATADPRILYRVNAGGPALASSSGPGWSADTDASPSPYHVSGSNRATWDPVPNVDGTVPAGTPREIFDSELWDPSNAPEQQWNFPVAAGTPLQVRLYFANRCSCTSGVGQRVFHVTLDGTRVLSNLDLVSAVGDQRGTMRSFTITSDGNVDIDLGHVVENPLINGIEILRTDLPAPSAGGLSKRSYQDGSVGASQAVPDGGIDWNAVRGAFMLNGQLYLAQSDGSLTRRAFNGTTYGAPVAVDTADRIVPLSDWRSDIQSMTGMFYDSGRIYFTRSGTNTLFYRYFTPQNDVVGARRLTAANGVTGIDYRQVRGMFGTGSKLYWATPDGLLHRADWAQGAQSGAPVTGTDTVTSGPGVDSATWGARAMFLHQDADGNGVGQPPTAAFTSSCASLTCHFDGTGSTSGGGSLSYAWQFGDGQTGSGSSPDHTYATGGHYDVVLTVTSASGTATVTHGVDVVKVNQPPTAKITYSCDALACDFDSAGSEDPDGSIASYAWSFGDGDTSTAVAPHHAYASAGTRTVTLTVTDNDSATATASASVTVSAAPAATVAFVAATSANANTANQRVTVPGAVQAGDTMVLYFAANATSATVTPPAGWTQMEALDGTNVLGRAWTRTATAGDPGSTVTVALSGALKADLSLAAYRATGGGSTQVVAHAGALDQASGTQHAAPAISATGPGQWVSTYWAAKASEAVSWAVPAGQTIRSWSAGAGGGLISAVQTDTGGPVPAGPVAAATGTTSVAVTRTVMFRTVIGLG